MWRVGMIDDETMAVQFLESLIDWNAHGYEVVGHALTASSAMMMTQEKKPDLLFVDICMPGENGLSLARRILEIQPGCQIVFLTSFREFDYAREALELGVAAFVLKYEMNPTRLVQLLEEIRPKLEKVGQQKTQALLRWLDACAEGNALDEAPFDPAKQYAFVIRRVPCSWGVKNAETQAEQSGLQALLAHSKTKDGDMLALFEQEAFGSVCSVRRRAEELAVALCQHWQASALVVHPFRSNRMEWTKRIPQALSRVVPVRLRRYVLLDEFSAMPVQPVKYPDQYALKARRMLEAYDSSAEEWILSPLKALAADALCEEHSLRYVRDYIVPLLPSLKDGLVFSTIEQLCQLLQEAIDAYMTAGASSAAERKMHKAKAYIQAHFDTDIYTALVAEAVGVSESSLRSNYRECFGITPKQEILQLRIEKAKHLLDEGSLPVGQIALACGFQSLQHFSRQFAKSTGVPPTAFSKRKEVDK